MPWPRAAEPRAAFGRRPCAGSSPRERWSHAARPAHCCQACPSSPALPALSGKVSLIHHTVGSSGDLPRLDVHCGPCQPHLISLCISYDLDLAPLLLLGLPAMDQLGLRQPAAVAAAGGATCRRHATGDGRAVRAAARCGTGLLCCLACFLAAWLLSSSHTWPNLWPSTTVQSASTAARPTVLPQLPAVCGTASRHCQHVNVRTPTAGPTHQRCSSSCLPGPSAAQLASFLLTSRATCDQLRSLPAAETPPPPPFGLLRQTALPTLCCALPAVNTRMWRWLGDLGARRGLQNTRLSTAWGSPR